MRSRQSRAVFGPSIAGAGFTQVQRTPSLLALTALVGLTLPACRGASMMRQAPTSESDCRSESASTTIVSATVVSASLGSSTSASLAGAGGPSFDADAVGASVAARPVAGRVAPSVRWIVAPDLRERASLDRWCAGVGPVVSARLADTAAALASSLVVVTWNTHIGGGDIPGLVQDLKAGAFTDGTPVHHFVLLLQEAYRAGAEVPTDSRAARPRPIHTMPKSSRRTDIVETARDLGLELFYVPSMANGRPTSTAPWEDRGNAILSSLPLHDLTAIELPFEAQRRVVAAATVEGTTASGKPWSLRLVNVHLDNKSRPSRLLQSLGGGRARQARALVAAIGGDSATVVGGDLNTWAMGVFEGATRVFARHFPLPLQHPTEATYAVGGLRLDRLMYRLPAALSAETRRLTDRRGSDHHPLIGMIRFGE